MSDKLRNIISTVAVALFIGVFAVLCVTKIFFPSEYSDVEKRPLAQLPTDVTAEQLLANKDYKDPVTGADKKAPIKQFEDFTVDQFPLREFFRNIKVNFVLNVLGIKENNGYAVEDGSIAQIETEFVPKTWSISSDVSSTSTTSTSSSRTERYTSASSPTKRTSSDATTATRHATTMSFVQSSRDASPT